MREELQPSNVKIYCKDEVKSFDLGIKYFFNSWDNSTRTLHVTASTAGMACPSMPRSPVFETLRQMVMGMDAKSIALGRSIAPMGFRPQDLGLVPNKRDL